MKQRREKQDSFSTDELVEKHTAMQKHTHTHTQCTDLSCGDDVFVFGVLIDGQREDVIGVFQVETLSSCSR